MQAQTYIAAAFAPAQLSLLNEAESLIGADGKPSLKAIRTQVFKKTQEQLAELLGVSVSTYVSWEKKRREPSGAAKTLIQMAFAKPKMVELILNEMRDAEQGARVGNASSAAEMTSMAM
ncbi:MULTISPECIES: helix-turn-helix domain-containing protein [Cupriavidus]|uniref:Helix-turn-helix domain-containing protein n=1 Tax=Cupriavidus basilensis TaxID=68895 RepID=A0A643FSM2_9BURK|nr:MULTISPECIES: helix-turn-helix domain-containing protein [Cupriavidus]MCY0853020.1 helix-turn-helix domain-containing protein [Cupriavidus sp. D39]QOT82243.1 helix-turn-helix domain-containing protein [Cupriavidus basilensis]